MKKTYLKPEIEDIKLNVESVICLGSIDDEGSEQVDPNGGDPDDF